MKKYQLEPEGETPGELYNLDSLITMSQMSHYGTLPSRYSPSQVFQYDSPDRLEVITSVRVLHFLFGGRSHKSFKTSTPLLASPINKGGLLRHLTHAYQGTRDR